MARLAPHGYQKLPSAPLRRLVQNMILVQRAPEQMIVRGVLRKRPVLLSQMCSARIAAAQFLMCRARQALSGVNRVIGNLVVERDPIFGGGYLHVGGTSSTSNNSFHLTINESVASLKSAAGVNVEAGDSESMNTQGGSISLAAGDGLSLNRGSGGSVSISAGRGRGITAGGGAGIGGGVSLMAGNSDGGDGGAVDITAGTTEATGSLGGAITLRSGSSTKFSSGGILIETAASTSETGGSGDVEIKTGISTGGKSGGILLSVGRSSAGSGGDVQFYAGPSSNDGVGGNMILKAGNAFNASGSTAGGACSHRIRWRQRPKWGPNASNGPIWRQLRQRHHQDGHSVQR